MRWPRLPVLGLLAAMLVGGSSFAAPKAPPGFAEHQRQCAGKLGGGTDGWSDPAPPLRIFANVYDVGTCGIVVLLVTGPDGHVLIDAATAEAAPSILANIRRLGIRPTDVKILLSSHEHFDHVGGLREIQRRTGARLIATAAARTALETGVAAANDPQRGILPGFAGVAVARTVRDGEVVALGPLRLTAHETPGHAPGSTSWSWRSCEGRRCRSIVYADSLTATSAEGYRFADHPAYVAAFRRTLVSVAALPCDLVVTPHPAASNLYARLAGTEPLAAPDACSRYAAGASARLDQRLAREGGAAVR